MQENSIYFHRSPNDGKCAHVLDYNYQSKKKMLLLLKSGFKIFSKMLGHFLMEPHTFKYISGSLSFFESVNFRFLFIITLFRVPSLVYKTFKAILEQTDNFRYGFPNFLYFIRIIIEKVH